MPEAKRHLQPESQFANAIQETIFVCLPIFLTNSLNLKAPISEHTISQDCSPYITLRNQLGEFARRSKHFPLMIILLILLTFSLYDVVKWLGEKGFTILLRFTILLKQQLLSIFLSCFNTFKTTGSEVEFAYKESTMGVFSLDELLWRPDTNSVNNHILLQDVSLSLSFSNCYLDSMAERARMFFTESKTAHCTVMRQV